MKNTGLRAESGIKFGEKIVNLTGLSEADKLKEMAKFQVAYVKRSLQHLGEVTIKES